MVISSDIILTLDGKLNPYFWLLYSEKRTVTNLSLNLNITLTGTIAANDFYVVGHSDVDVIFEVVH